MIDFKTLNGEQKAAVTYIEGPQLVVAGAGSGKTRVLTYKIAHLLENGFEPQSILALTFTNKAAKEMKERIKHLIGAKADYLWMGTFHSVFAKILRTEAENINFSKNFSIYDTEDSKSLVSNVIEELKLGDEFGNVGHTRHKISYFKNLLVLPNDYLQNSAVTPQDIKFGEIYKRYQEQLLANNAMDFEDLLLKPLELFESKRNLLQKYRKKFSYFLIDEFQDTNIIQYELIKILATKDGLVCAVGDDAQSIYSWRGADVRNMLNFSKDFSKAQTFPLQKNYRSTKNILGAADSVIKKNLNQLEKTLYTDNPAGEPLILVKCTDEKDEALQIAKLIKEEIYHNKFSFNNFAVFYRTNAQSRSMEDIFLREGIAYIIIGGIEFYKRKEVKDMIAYLKVIANPKDEESLLRVMNFPQRGIGVTTIGKMVTFARRHNITLFETMARVFEVIDIKERIQKHVKNFKVLLDKFMNLKSELSASELSRALVDELQLVQMFKEENTIEAMERLDNIEQLMSAITEFNVSRADATLEDYLQEVSLVAGIDMKNDKNNVVSLMTVHSSKGLEFPVVFVSGLEEEVFPLSNRFSEEASLEEERRLFYVALTRARQKVFLTHARSRYRFGEVAYQNRSRFIDEIDPQFVSEDYGSAGRRANRKSKKEIYYEYFENVDYVDFKGKNDVSLHVGARVMHETFGLGKVSQIIGAGDSKKVSVVFEGNNTKLLMLKVAKLKVLNN